MAGHPTSIKMPVLAALATVGTIISLGTAVSLLFNTSLHTSAMTAAVPSHRDFWFADKRNPFNVYFVKLGWAWTSLFCVVHWTASVLHGRAAASEPSSGTTRMAIAERQRNHIRRAVKYAIATLIWISFQYWFNSRVFALSGGTCALQLPDALAVDEDKWIGLPGIGAQRIIHKGGQGAEPASAWLPIANEFCQRRLPISAVQDPALRDALGTLVDIQGEENKRFLMPSFRGGIDISGHVFLLTTSSALIFDELAPTVRLVLRDGWSGLVDRKAGWHIQAGLALSKAIGSGLLLLWSWMLLVTSIFFHSPAEKFSGFLTGVIGAYAFKLGAELFVPFVHGLWAGRADSARQAGVERKDRSQAVANGRR